MIDFALELASADQEVILFDLDLRNPELASRLGADGKGDLGTVLPPHSALAEALVPVPDRPAIKVLPGIRDRGRATLEKIGRRLPALIAQARTRRAYVLIDTSPLGEFGDALRFAPAVDDVVVVARLDHTGVTAVQEVRELLERAGTPAAGYVVVEGGSAVLRERPRLPSAAFARPGGDSPEPPAHETVARPADERSDPFDRRARRGRPSAERPRARCHLERANARRVPPRRARRRKRNAVQLPLGGGRLDHRQGHERMDFWRARVENEYLPLAELRKRLPPHG